MCGFTIFMSARKAVFNFLVVGWLVGTAKCQPEFRGLLFCLSFKSSQEKLFTNYRSLFSRIV